MEAASPAAGRSGVRESSGQVSDSKISLNISGGVTGTMSVAYTPSRQSVSISTQGIALESVKIDLTRS